MTSRDMVYDCNCGSLGAEPHLPWCRTQRSGGNANVDEGLKAPDSWNSLVPGGGGGTRRAPWKATPDATLAGAFAEAGLSYRNDTDELGCDVCGAGFKSQAEALLHANAHREGAKHGLGKKAASLPDDSTARKEFPLATGVLDYFPDALLAVAQVSKIGNDQHSPGEPLHWARDKSTDEANTLARHFLQRGTLDTDGQRHSAKVAWRALALLQKEIEADRS